MFLRRPNSTYLMAVLLAASSTAALAAPPRPPVYLPQRDTSVPRNDDALSDSVRRVERTTRAQVLSAERVPFDGRDVNRIKTVDGHGRVRIFMDDPSNTPPSNQDAPTRGNDD
ncbi:MAG: hypothetical protein JWL98_871 [Xanthomonadaceae bacterium]|nr:hypothetical protein [Xanthomonadaceae bacterium]